MAEQSMYKRLQALESQGIVIRRANHFEQRTNEYGEKLVWVIALGDRQALSAYHTKLQAIEAAERYLP